MSGAIVECIECSSPMVFRDNIWQCDNCFAVLTGADMHIDDVMIEEGQSMADVMKQYEERDSDR